jgi:phenylacetate-CoA ligase
VPNREKASKRLLWTARMIVEAAGQARFPFAAEAAVRMAQERRLRATVAYAHAHVPYYRETMRRLILGPEDLGSAGELARLPLLERDHLQRDPEYFVSREWPADVCVIMQSGGTTGAPLTIFRDPPSLFLEAAHRERMRSLIARLAGRRGRYREAHIRPDDSSVATAIGALRRRTLLPTGVRVHRRAFSMFRSPAELITELDEFRPDVITSYGSYLEALFGYLREHAPRVALPRVAVHGADALSPETREWAKTELGIEVLSSYNAIETPQIGFDCEYHRGHHLNVDLCPVRLVRPDGSDAPGEATGEIVVSNLVNRATVLLNYRLGDVVTRVEDPCPCGRTLPLYSYLERRGTRWLDLGGGRRMHSQALKLVLRARRGIWRYQIVQETLDRFLLRLVPSPEFDREVTKSQVLEQFRHQLGNEIAVRVEFVTDLPRGPSGKVQPIVGLLPSSD